MPITTLQVSVDPTFILEAREHLAGGLGYDPDFGVLTYYRDRNLPEAEIQFLLPRAISGYELSFEPTAVTTATAQPTEIGEWLVLPGLRMYQEYPGELGFAATEPGADGAPRPKVKVKVTIRVRPTGGG
jgi:hypothetical protein